MSRFFSSRNQQQSTTAVDNMSQQQTGNILVKDQSLGVASPSSLKQDPYLASGSTLGTNLKQDSYLAGTSGTTSSTFAKEGQLLHSQQQSSLLTDGQYRGVISSQTFPNQVGGSFSVTRLEEQELLRRGEQIPGKVIQLPEMAAFTINHPEVCIAQEKLLIKHQPVTVAQPPVVIRPEAISLPQQPFMWQPEPIAIPLPPLTIQPEPIVIERPPLTVNPDSYVVHRPNVVLNPTFSVRLTYPGQCPPDSVCVPASQSSALSTSSTTGVSGMNYGAGAASGSSFSSSSMSSSSSSTLGTSRSSYNKSYNV